MYISNNKYTRIYNVSGFYGVVPLNLLFDPKRKHFLNYKKQWTSHDEYRAIQNDGLNFVRPYFLNYTTYMDDLHNIWKRGFWSSNYHRYSARLAHSRAAASVESKMANIQLKFFFFALVNSLDLSRRLRCSVRFVFVSTLNLQRRRAFVLGIANFSIQAVSVKAKAPADRVYQRRTWHELKRVLSVAHWTFINFIVSTNKCNLDHIYQFQFWNIAIRNWVYLFESPCIT
jgi:hypothetical protein